MTPDELEESGWSRRTKKMLSTLQTTFETDPEISYDSLTFGKTKYGAILSSRTCHATPLFSALIDMILLMINADIAGLLTERWQLPAFWSCLSSRPKATSSWSRLSPLLTLL